MPSADNSDVTIYRRLLSSAGWVFMMRWGMRAIGLVNMVILARLLAPEDFGIMAMGVLLIGLLNGFMEFGAESLLIREQQTTRDHCDTAWTIQLCQGATMALLLSALAYPASLFFSEPRLTAVIHLIALSSLVSGFANIGMVLVRKELDFAKDFRFGIINRLVGFVITVTLAFALRNYWALVYGQIASSVFLVLHSYLLHPYRPRLSLARFRDYFHFSLSIVPLNISRFLINKIDVLIVGRLSGTSEVGAYNISSELSAMGTREIVAPLSRAIYPNYAKLTGDIARVVEIFRYVLSTVAIFCVPIGLGLWVVADSFTLVVLGPQWNATVPLLRWLAIYGILYSLVHVITGPILIVIGRERLAASLGWVRLAIMVPIVIYAAATWGPVGAAAGMTISGAIALPIASFFLLRSIPLSALQLVTALWRPVVAGLLMVLAVEMAFNGEPLLAPAARLCLSIALGVIVYFFALLGLWVMAGRPAGTEFAVVRFVMSILPSQQWKE